ncbi:FAD-dependent oxidoreductase, partial [Blastococcus sp. URHD0036]|uniref:FAD-dependent oxidoreductase n=1 Tax=Blastococcus sp. URHD0036 TaxID=1380356 RepID=UPI0004982C45
MPTDDTVLSSASAWSVHDIEWDLTSDVVVVGSGAAGLSAAVTAAAEGASVIVLERAGALGGTTAKSGGGMWIPNNPLMQEQGLADPRAEALDYMSRIAFPDRYDRDAPTHGVPTAELALLETFYDRGAEAVQVLVDAGGLYLNRERGHIFPDYHADLPQNAAPIGRSFGPAMPPEQELAAGQAVNANLPGGTILIEVLRQAAKARGVKLLLGHRVVHVHQDDDGAVVGVEVHAGRGRGTVLVGARRGV